jgi:carboxymethylenebutenolidase
MAPHNALGTHDQEAYDRIWPQVLDFLHQHLG